MIMVCTLVTFFSAFAVAEEQECKADADDQGYYVVFVSLFVGLITLNWAYTEGSTSPWNSWTPWSAWSSSHEEETIKRGERRRAVDSRSIGEGGSVELDKCSEVLLEDKWKMLFKFFDLNHDKIINWRDMIVQGNIFSTMYNLDDCEKNTVNSKLYEYWSCLTLDKLNKGLSEETFVKQITKSYGQNKVQTIQQLQKCVNIMVTLLDQDNDGFLIIDEVAAFYKSFNMGNKNIIENRYRQMCPVSQKCCPLQNATDNWTELLVGMNENAYDAINKIWEDAGMPLDDLV